MTTKDDCIQKYNECKKTMDGAIPNSVEFINYSGISQHKLASVFGRNAYARLQQECGDEANKFLLERTPRETILKRYGDLALETLTQERELPNSTDWMHRKLRPSVGRLRTPPHDIKWGEFPHIFREWIETANIKGYEKVIDYIDRTVARPTVKVEKVDRDFENVVRDIRSWSPARWQRTSSLPRNMSARSARSATSTFAPSPTAS